MKEKVQVQLSGGGLSSTALTVLKIRELDHIFVVDYNQDEQIDEWEAVNKTITALSMPFPLVQCSLINLKFNNWLEKANSDVDPKFYNRGKLLMFIQCCACEAIAKFGVEKPIEILLALDTEDIPQNFVPNTLVKEINDVLYLSFGNTMTGDQPLIQISVPYLSTSRVDLVSMALGKIKQYADINKCQGADEYIIWDYSMPSETKTKIKRELRG